MRWSFVLSDCNFLLSPLSSILTRTEINLRLMSCSFSAYTLLTSNQFAGHLKNWEQAENMLCILPCWETDPLPRKQKTSFYMKAIIPYGLIQDFPKFWVICCWWFRISVFPKFSDFSVKSITSRVFKHIAHHHLANTEKILDFKGRFSSSNHP